MFVMIQRMISLQPMNEGLIYMRVDFGVLRNIIRDRNNKQKAATDSAECLREFLKLRHKFNRRK